jgi:hypothetical protein
LKSTKQILIVLMCIFFICSGILLVNTGSDKFKSETSISQNNSIRSNAYDDSGTETLSGGGYYAMCYNPLTVGHRVLMWTQTSTDSLGLDLFVCDEYNFNEFVAGRSASVYCLHEDMHICTIDFTSPQTKKWYFVWSNRGNILARTFDWFLDTNGDDIPSYSGHSWDNNGQSIEPGEWYHVYATYNLGDSISGYFKSWVDSDSIDFFVCDDANYATWASGGGATVYCLKENYIYTSWGSFTIPSAGVWHCVYSARDAPDTVTISAYMNQVIAKTITVTSPTGSSSWETGYSYYIYWDSTGSISNVKIELYKGTSLTTTISSSTTNDGIYYWAVPYSITNDGTDYRIKITSTSDLGVYDYSPYFEIVVTPTITVTSPTSSSSWEPGSSHYIFWTSTGSISNVIIELYKGVNLALTVSPSTTNDGSFYWTIPPATTTGTDYRIKIISSSDAGVYDYSSYFSIEYASITVTSPTIGSSWETNSLLYIGWTSTGSISNVIIELYQGDTYVKTISATTSNDGYYYWTIPASTAAGTDYRVKITSTSDAGVYSYSSYFEIERNPTIPGFSWLFLVIGIITIASVIFNVHKKSEINLNLVI